MTDKASCVTVAVCVCAMVVYFTMFTAACRRACHLVPTTSVTEHTETVITRRGGKPFLKVSLFTTSSVALYTETAAMPSGEESIISRKQTF